MSYVGFVMESIQGGIQCYHLLHPANQFTITIQFQEAAIMFFGAGVGFVGQTGLYPDQDFCRIWSRVECPNLGFLWALAQDIPYYVMVLLIDSLSASSKLWTVLLPSQWPTFTHLLCCFFLWRRKGIFVVVAAYKKMFASKHLNLFYYYRIEIGVIMFWMKNVEKCLPPCFWFL